jgi:putative membrane protein
METAVPEIVVPHLAYCGMPPFPGELLHRFNLDAVLITVLVLLTLAHCILVTGRKARIYALSGWLVAAAALLTPLCALSVALFSARIAQHMILLLIAAPLIALAWRKPLSQHSGLSAWIAAAAFCIALWFWHMPVPYDDTFSSSFIYWLMQTTLFGSGIALWRELLHHRRSRTGEILLLSALSSMQMGLLGALFTLAARPLFLAHLSTTAAWGYTPLQDQQLGGILMWVPGILLFLWVGLRTIRMSAKPLSAPAP